MKPHDYAVNRCITSAYLTLGILAILKKDRPTYAKLTEGHGCGQDGLVRDICEVALVVEDWYEAEKVEPEHMTDGVYYYEVIEEDLSHQLVAHAATHGSLPGGETIKRFLNNMRDKQTERNKKRAERIGKAPA